MTPRVLAVCGPTGAGKSALALALAKKLGGEIVSCDSMQIYRGLDIGTAKPTAAERAAVPHHLIDILEPEQRYSVADYVRDARAAIADIFSRGRVPVVCGGTGLYLSSLVHGVCFREDAAADEALRQALRARFAAEGAAPFLAELAAADPAYAASFAPADEKRILRAVELLRTTGETVPQQNARSRQAGELPCLCFSLVFADRAKLYCRIDARVDAMLAAGLLEEARRVYENRAAYLTAAAAIGYKEWFPYFEGTASAEACAEKLKQATRNYAKRQLTWFRRETGFIPLDAGEHTEKELIDTAAEVWAQGECSLTPEK